MRILEWFCFFIFFGLLSASTYAQRAQHVVWAYVSFKPLIYTEQDHVRGSLVDTLDPVFKKAGIHYSSIELPSKRVQKYLKEDKANFFVGLEAFIDEPKDYWKSDLPISSLNLEAVSLSSTTEITHLSELYNQPLIVMLGYSYGSLQYELDSGNFTVMTRVTSHETGIKALVENRGKYLLGYHSALKHLTNSYPGTRFNHFSISSKPMYFFLRKSLAKSELIMNKLNKAHIEISKGEITKS